MRALALMLRIDQLAFASDVEFNDLTSEACNHIIVGHAKTVGVSLWRVI
jgi:hypothetical protein